MASYKLIDVKWHKSNSSECTLTVEKISWFGLRREIQKFRGGCTVWHCATTARRASSSLESILADFWTLAKWQREPIE